MTLLLPAGLLGLIGLIILLIIYLIRPNYQTKFISTTFVWKLSLKYRKKKLPTSKLRNILLIICQVLLITIAAMILAKPVHMFLTEEGATEAIAIIDAGASMRTETEGETRYERAVELVRKKSEEIFAEEGYFSVINADRTPTFVCSRVSVENKADVTDALDDLLDDGLACSYATPDVNKAIDICEDILRDNQACKIYLYTDTTYSYVPSDITVINVTEEGEWNAAILNAYTEFNDNYYDIIVEVACYGRDYELGINVFVDGANAADKYSGGDTVQLKGSYFQVGCYGDNVIKVVFKATNFVEYESDNEVMFDISDNKFYSFNSISVYLDEDDNYQNDNSFQIYGGLKEEIKIQYASTLTNPFVNKILETLQAYYAGQFDVVITENKGEDYALEGYDYYIFEHIVPAELPKDGVIIYLDPAIASIPSDAGFKVSEVISYNKTEMPFTIENEDDPLLAGVDLDPVTLTRVDKITYYDPAYTVLATVNNDPVLLARRDGNRQIFVMAFSVHYTNMTQKLAWPYIWNNIFKTYTPSIIEKNAYEVYDEVSVNSRSETVTVYKDGNSVDYTAFPAKFTVVEQGTYEITQTTYFGTQLEEKIYVRAPRSESNIYEKADALNEPYKENNEKSAFNDLLFWFALAIVIVTALEWFLKNRENA